MYRRSVMGRGRSPNPCSLDMQDGESLMLVGTYAQGVAGASQGSPTTIAVGVRRVACKQTPRQFARKDSERVLISLQRERRERETLLALSVTEPSTAGVCQPCRVCNFTVDAVGTSAPPRRRKYHRWITSRSILKQVRTSWLPVTEQGPLSVPPVCQWPPYGPRFWQM